MEQGRSSPAEMRMLRTAISLPNASGLLEVDIIGMAGRWIGLRHMEKVAVAVPIRRTDDDKPPASENRVQAGMKSSVGGAMGAEREAVLPAHKSHLASKLEHIGRCRRP